MIHNYKIKYDINKDMWNWRGALCNSFMDFDWIDNIDNIKDREIANKIKDMNKQSAEAILRPYLLAKKADLDSKLNKFIRIAEKDFHDKFKDACLALEHITKRPMMSNRFTFYITTFPRMPYFYEKCEIFIYDSTEGVWGMPIDGFLHEALHFQFTYYWRYNNDSPVSRLSEDEFDYIKEALTIVLDDELKPLIIVPDEGYPLQATFCKTLHEHWKKYHDFDKLVSFGLKRLPDFISK